jgi:hypothetical protein
MTAISGCEGTARCHRVPVLALAGLILLKAALLLWIGPLTSPDTSGYVAIADAMRSGVYWGALDLHDPATAALVARAPGFPVLLALAHAISGPATFWLVAVVQGALGVIAAITLYGFTAALLRHRGAALLVAAAYATGLPLALDQTMLTDGAYASLLVILLCTLGRLAIRRTPVSYGIALALGLLPAAALMVRESTPQVVVVMLPVIACFVVAVGSRVLPRLGILVSLLLPLVAVYGGISAFNEARTGSAFLSTGLRTALLVPPVQMQARGAPVFDTDDPVVRVLRAEIGDFRNENIYAAVTRAEQRLGMTPVAMTGAIRAFFFRSVAAYPGTYAAVVLSELRPRYFALSVAPAASVGTLIASRGGELVSVSQSVPAEGAGRLLTFGLYGATALAGGLCWLAMVVGLPVAAVRRTRQGVGLDLALLLMLAACHLGLLLLYALVHIEARYLVAVQFIPPLALAWLLLAWRRRER